MSDKMRNQLFKISLSLTSAFGPDEDFKTINKYEDFWRKINNKEISVPSDIFLGIRDSNKKSFNEKYQHMVKKFLDEVFDVRNEDGLYFAMKECLKGTSSWRDFNSNRGMISAMPSLEKKNFINSIRKDGPEFFKYYTIIQYDKSLPSSGILAWDIANYTSLCRLGAYVGYLKQNTLADHLQRTAILAQGNYSSFREFGVSSIVGQLYTRGYNQYEKSMKDLYRSITSPDSFWNNIEWDIGLD